MTEPGQKHKHSWHNVVLWFDDYNVGPIRAISTEIDGVYTTHRNFKMDGTHPLIEKTYTGTKIVTDGPAGKLLPLTSWYHMPKLARRALQFHNWGDEDELVYDLECPVNTNFFWENVERSFTSLYE